MPQPFWPGGPAKLEDLLSSGIQLVGVVIVLWFVNMALTGWIASRKGREDGAWALVALFLGPMALLAVVLLPRKVKTVAAPPPTVSSNDARGGWGEEVKR